MAVAPRYQSRELRSLPTIDGVVGTLATSRPSGAVRKATAIPWVARCSSARWKAMVLREAGVAGRRMAATREGRRA